MGSGVTRLAHSSRRGGRQQWAHRAVILAALLAGLGACLEPVPELKPEGAPESLRLAGCSPLTCTGCCDPDGVCQGGNTDGACGYDGRACSVCPATHRCETPGACYPFSLSSGEGPQDGGTPVNAGRCDGVSDLMRCQ